MIAASAVLVVVALVLLIFGVFQDGLELVFGSIAASVVAAVSLFLGVMRDRRAPAGVPGYPPTEGVSAAELAAARGREEAQPASAADEELPRPEEAPTLTGVGAGTSLQEEPPLILPDEDEEAPAEPTLTLPEIPRSTAAKKPARRKAAKKPAAKKKPATKKKGTKKSSAKKSTAAKKKAAKKPAAKKKATKKPAARKKATKKPAARKKATKKSSAKKSTAKRRSGS